MGGTVGVSIEGRRGYGISVGDRVKGCGRNLYDGQDECGLVGGTVGVLIEGYSRSVCGWDGRSGV